MADVGRGRVTATTTAQRVVCRRNAASVCRFVAKSAGGNVTAWPFKRSVAA
jgi:hypothetical protein